MMRLPTAAQSTEAFKDMLVSRLHTTNTAKSPIACKDIGPSSGHAAHGSSHNPQIRPDEHTTPIPPLEWLPSPSPLDKSEVETMRFVTPRKRIVSPSSLQRWASSETLREILGFVMTCNRAVVGRKLSETIELSHAATTIVALLENVVELIGQIPPESEGTSRFGNPAFRTLYAHIKESSRRWHTSIPNLEDIRGANDIDDGANAISEAEVYFYESFGNENRVDYGSGMELNFACWLLCLVKLGVIDLRREAPAIVLRIFWRYIEVMRLIQSTYWLEPAGSHGVWGLDDYHFLPFVFGSAQLVTHPIFRPKSIHDEEILDDYSADYMYFACIRFINGIKTASLRWHSPMLDDISSVRSWTKVNEGMLKMYKAEVLLKLPIAQHMYFGSLLPFPQIDEGEEDADSQLAVDNRAAVHTDDLGCTHLHTTIPNASAAAQAASGWGDCCGIPIPSPFGAAAKEEQDRLRGIGGSRSSKFESGVRRVPFD